MALGYILWKRGDKHIFFWSVGVSGVLVPAKKLVIFLHLLQLFREGYRVQWWQHWALFSGSSVHFGVHCWWWCLECCFQHPVCIFKYGNKSIPKRKIEGKYGKNQKRIEMMLSVLGGDFRIKGGCPKLEIWLLLLRNGRTCNYLGLWLTDDIAYKFQSLEYTSVIHISMRGFHRNRIIKNPGLGISACLSFRWLWGISIWMFKHNQAKTSSSKLQVIII